jgi:hypothetical protein
MVRMSSTMPPPSFSRQARAKATPRGAIAVTGFDRHAGATR